MGRWSLVAMVLVLVISTVSAHASEPCWRSPCWQDPQLAILPAAGARDVPRNTKLWVLGAEQGPWEVTGGDVRWIGTGTVIAQDRAAMTVQHFDLPELAGDRLYRARGIDAGPLTSFTTGSADDLTAPAPPVVRTLAFGIEDDLVQMAFDAVLDPDVVMLRFTFTIEGISLSLITTPQRLQLESRCGNFDPLTDPPPRPSPPPPPIGPAKCEAALLVVPGDHVLVSVSAIDLAGNESAATTREVEASPILWPSAPVPGLHAGTRAPRDFAEASGRFPQRAAGLGLGVLAVLAVMLVRHFRRTVAVTRTTPGSR